MKPLTLLTLLALSGIFPGLACAEKADRDKPVNLEADRIVIDDVKKQHILEGNVQLMQGTLLIRCERLVVTQDAEGFQRGIATGGAKGLAHFRQKREGKDEYVDGEAERIVHDGKAEKTEFFVRAYVRSGNDEVRGEYILYDGRTENYVVSSNPEGAAAGSSQRVRAVIQPKSRDNAAATSASPAAESPAGAPALRSGARISNTHQDEDETP